MVLPGCLFVCLLILLLMCFLFNFYSIEKHREHPINIPLLIQGDICLAYAHSVGQSEN